MGLPAVYYTTQYKQRQATDVLTPMVAEKLERRTCASTARLSSMKWKLSAKSESSTTSAVLYLLALYGGIAREQTESIRSRPCLHIYPPQCLLRQRQRYTTSVLHVVVFFSTISISMSGYFNINYTGQRITHYWSYLYIVKDYVRMQAGDGGV